MTVCLVKRVQETLADVHYSCIFRNNVVLLDENDIAQIEYEVKELTTSINCFTVKFSTMGEFAVHSVVTVVPLISVNFCLILMSECA